jgi:hypothetical protein
LRTQCSRSPSGSTDYGVFLLTRIKEARDAGMPNDEAVAVGLERTGRIVTAAAVLFSVAVGAFGTSEIIFIKELGIGTALAVLIDATIVRALLVPSLMKLLGDLNWWRATAARAAARPHRAARGRARLTYPGGATSDANKCCSVAAGSSLTPVCTGEGWIAVLEGEVIQPKRSLLSRPAIGPAVGSPAATCSISVR